MKDKLLKNLIKKEIDRQKMTINLIASENYATSDVSQVLGTPLVNKYSEGYPGKRYYPGNRYYDAIENLAVERAKKIFKLGNEWHVNVQPYSGSPANLAIYFALMNIDDTLMGLNLASGGHLTHGAKVNFSGRLYNVIPYYVDKQTGFLNYEAIKKAAIRHKPKIIVSGFSAYPRKVDFEKFGEIAKKAGAYHVADISHIAGLVASGMHPSPFPYSDVVMTTTHKTLRGPRGAIIFCRKELAHKIDQAVFPGVQGGPHNNVIAAKALAFLNASSLKFKQYQKRIVKNAAILARTLDRFGFTLVTGGTDTHLILLDLKKFNLDGFSAEKLLERFGITANRNSLLDDKSPYKPTGLRLGTPAVTSRGMKEKEMKQIGELIYRCLIKKEDVSKEVKKLCAKFPLEY